MTKISRKRKKQLKKRGAWVNDRELWNLDVTICEWILPRLRRFKEINIAYPGRPPYETFEKWQSAIDTMIHSFELLRYDVIDYTRDAEGKLVLRDNDDYSFNVDKYKEIYNQWEQETQEGLEIFCNNFSHLWI